MDKRGGIIKEHFEFCSGPGGTKRGNLKKKKTQQKTTSGHASVCWRMERDRKRRSGDKDFQKVKTTGLKQ